jgi:hypothetical protein
MKLPEIALIYARKQACGGSTSFTVHLYRAMLRAGIDVKIYRPSLKERAPALIGKYDNVTGHYVTLERARYICKHIPSLLTGPDIEKNLPTPDCLISLMKAGMRIVVHDPNEFKNFPHVNNKTLVHRPICIRPTMHRFFPEAVFIPHPYCREFKGWQGEDLPDREPACSIARMTFIKRVELLLEANRKLDKGERIRFHGSENRLYTYFKLCKKFPEFKQGGYDLPLEWGVSARAARKYKFAIDMTYLPKDGGGSQYTFMEAWDAGTVNVIHGDWLRYREKYQAEMKPTINCLVAYDSDDIAGLVKNCHHGYIQDLLREISIRSTQYLEKWHDPMAVASLYYKELTGKMLPIRKIRFPREKDNGKVRN